MVAHTLKKFKKSYLNLINSKQFQKFRYLASERVPKKHNRKCLSLITKGYLKLLRRRRINRRMYQNNQVTMRLLSPMACQKNVAVSERRTKNILNEHNRKLKKLRLV